MIIDIFDVIIASLLHDIGKVMQRAEIDQPGKYDDRCPTYKNQPPSHLHVKWTEDFFVRYPYKKDPAKWQIITNLAASHHRPDAFEPASEKWLIQCIVSADRISSKWDREDPEEYTRERYKKRPMYSIFDVINLNQDKIDNPFQRRMPLISLKDFGHSFAFNKTDVFPSADESNKKSGEYRLMFDAFIKEYKLLMSKWNEDYISKKQFVYALDNLLEEYFWSVPTNTNEPNPTNSLYHHSKSTAAIAATLFSVFKDSTDRSAMSSLITSDKKDFLLIGGDLSGIQTYIFDLNPEGSKYVSKTLRARSFKIKILSDMVIYHIVDVLGLAQQNTLINVGGKFMIIAPNNLTVKEKLKQIRYLVEKEFFEMFRGQLSLNLNWSTEISFKEIGKELFPETLTAFIQNLDLMKKRKFFDYFNHDERWQPRNFLNNSEEIYSDNVCQYCRMHSVEEKRENERICRFCLTDKTIGQKLPRVVYGIITDRKEKGAMISLFDGAVNFSFSDELPKRRLDNGYYFRLKESADAPAYIPYKAIASHLPVNEQGIVLSFDEIAAGAVFNGKGTELNAMVKGDVDNLGLLFRRGLTDQKGHFSLTKYSTFSAMIDYFFARYIPLMIREKYPNIYIIYSGGDDFALIGPWNQTIDFIISLRDDFKTFTFDNPLIHFSAGVELMKGRHPVKHGISGADALLERSKKLKDNCKSIIMRKNAVTIFNTTLQWDEFSKMMETADQFQWWLDNVGGFSSQFLYRLFQYNESYLRFQRDHRAEDLMYISHLNYDLRRNILTKRNSEKIKEDIRRFFGSLLSKDNSVMKYLQIPLHKVLYDNR